jgi:Ca2+-binding EF-hand superfamily protein
MQYKKSENNTKSNHLEEAFQLFDKDKDGLITASELQ